VFVDHSLELGSDGSEIVEATAVEVDANVNMECNRH